MTTVVSLPLSEGRFIVDDLVATIRANRDQLSEIDAATGDGDHGINMAKGFALCAERMDAEDVRGAGEAFEALTMALMDDIGGSMGPLYGSFFLEFQLVFTGRDTLDAALFGQALAAGVASVQELGSAKVGDKTLMDTLVPAEATYRQTLAEGGDFIEALAAMSAAAERGKDSTKDMQARIGRAARLGERSIGTVDAGATSCFLILKSMADSITRRLAS
jgi:dihydroxyacetone kinase-like protein